jgi:hypothetical protein
MAAEHILHMQKALTQMNLQLHHVLSDITGISGQAILDAILSGKRDPVELAQLCHSRVKSPRDTVAQALVGDYRPEHLFTLKQSLEGYRYYQKLILELDQETARLMQALPSATEDPMPPRTKATAYQRQGNDPQFDLRSELYRIAGVDLTDLPGVSAATAQVILTEIGTDVSRFRSWLGLCPEKRVSGGKMLSCKTRKVKHRAATALRMGANSLCRAKGYFGEFFRRMRAKLGTAQAITATAHKIARILYHVLLTKQPYAETVFHRCDEQVQQRAEMRLPQAGSSARLPTPTHPGNWTMTISSSGADLNEAALRRTLSRARTERHRRFETKSLEELSVSRYDEAIPSLACMVGSVNSDLKLAPQVLLFPISSRPKSIEIP